MTAEETIALYKRLLSSLLQGDTMNELCEEIKAIVGHEVAVVTPQFALLGQSYHFDWWNMLPHDGENYTKNFRKSSIQSKCEIFNYTNTYLDEAVSYAILVSINHGDTHYGYIMIVMETENSIISADEIQALEFATIAANIEIIKQNETNQIMRRFWNEFLQALINEEYKTFEDIHKRAAAIGLNLEDRYALAITRRQPFYKIYQEALQEQPHLNLPSLIYRDLMANIMKVRKMSPLSKLLVCEYQDHIVFFIPRVKNSPIFLQNLVAEIRSLLGVILEDPYVKLGVSRWCAVNAIHNGYTEAFKALQICTSLGHSTMFFEELDSVSIFLDTNGMLDTEAMEDYCLSVLGPIIHYDKFHASGLLNALDSYMNNNLSVTKTAQELFIHKNTLRYRLNKIANFTNASFSNIDDIVNFSIALKIYHYLSLNNHFPH